MKPTGLLITLTLIGVMGLEGCTLAPQPAMSTITPTPPGFTPLGHWEVMHWINYSNLPETNMKGDIGPAYLPYLVSLAGFHTDTFGLTVGPDDELRFATDSGQSWTKAASALHCCQDWR